MNKKIVIPAGNIFVILLSLLLYATGALDAMSRANYDFVLKNNMSHQPNADILLVGIDTSSLEKLGKYPFDRSVYANLIDKLEQGGAKVIAFDVEFYTEGANPASDKLLSDTLSKYKNVILPVHGDMESELARATVVSKGQPIKAKEIVKPIPMLAQYASLGHINAVFEDDGSIRRTWLQIDSPDGKYPSLGYKTAEMAGADVKRYLDYPALKNRPKDEMYIKYDANVLDFETIPLYRVLNGEIPPQTFQDRVVFVGYTAPGSDQGTTPVEQQMNLVYAHANIASQLMNGEYVKYQEDWIEMLLMLLCILIIGFLTWRLRSIFLSVIATLGVSVVLFVAQIYLFSSSHNFLDLVYAESGIYVAFLINLAIKIFLETKQKNYIAKQFGRFVPKTVVDQIIASGEEVKLGGQRMDITLIFVDIRGFTPMSEKLEPEQVIQVLNEYLDVCTKAILKFGGTLDKFIGDGVMSIFGAPIPMDNHPVLAVRAALEMKRQSADLEQRLFDQHGLTVRFGLGINSGPAVVGNIGSEGLRLDYTAIGDTVNLSARLESNAKPGQVLISPNTYERVKDLFDIVPVGEIKVKGKELPVMVYEVMDEKEEPGKVEAAASAEGRG
jgi:adenylate cyclase